MFNSTPQKVIKLSNKINKLNNIKSINSHIDFNSYSPTINKELITLRTTNRDELKDCNIEKAFQLKEPLKIGIPGSNKCYDYFTPESQKFLLHNLSANKHIDITKIVPPMQYNSNCWFNAMFVTFFVSDKGRKFFHFLRQLMIEGTQKNGTPIPDNLKNAFALLNFAVDACLTGNEYAYTLNTNSVIQLLYKYIPTAYKEQNPYIVDIDQAGNPLLYYTSIINYLHNNSLQILFIRSATSDFSKQIHNELKGKHLPHIIVLEVFDNEAPSFNTKPKTFSVENAKYVLDSAVVRDTSKQHFCANLTCERKELAYDGVSYHRLNSMKWKQDLNSNVDWEFDGTVGYNTGIPLKWNFMKSYQLLMYYREK